MFNYNFNNTFYLKINLVHRYCSGMRLVVLSSNHGTRTISRVSSGFRDEESPTKNEAHYSALIDSLYSRLKDREAIIYIYYIAHICIILPMSNFERRH